MTILEDPTATLIGSKTGTGFNIIHTMTILEDPTATLIGSETGTGYWNLSLRQSG